MTLARKSFYLNDVENNECKRDMSDIVKKIFKSCSKKIYNILKILLLTDLSHWGMFAGDKFDSAKLSYT